MSPATDPVPAARRRLPRPAYLVPLLLVGLVTLALLYSSVLNAVAYDGVRTRLGPDETVPADLADQVTIAMRWPLTVSLVAAVSLTATLRAAGRRCLGVAVPVLAVVVPPLAIIAATTVAWLALGLPLGLVDWLTLVAVTTARALALGLAATALGWGLWRVGGGRVTAFWVAYAVLWGLASTVVLGHELSGIGMTGEDLAERDSWTRWMPLVLAASAMLWRFEAPNGVSDSLSPLVASLALVALLAAAVAIAAALSAARPSQHTARRGVPPQA